MVGSGDAFVIVGVGRRIWRRIIDMSSIFAGCFLSGVDYEGVFVDYCWIIIVLICQRSSESAE
jgi:hypothetical protein